MGTLRQQISAPLLKYDGLQHDNILKVRKVLEATFNSGDRVVQDMGDARQ